MIAQFSSDQIRREQEAGGQVHFRNGRLREPPPWAYAAIARESIMYGSELRSRPVTEERIRHLSNLLQESYDEDPDDDIVTLLSGIMYEQFPYETGLLEELARAYAILVEQDTDAFKFNNSAWVEVFGASLSDAISSLFVLFAIASTGDGSISVDLIRSAESRIWQIVSKDQTSAIFQLLTASVEVARAHGFSSPDVRLTKQRYAFNPLLHFPLINVGGKCYAPQPKHIIWCATLESLYYRAVKVWGRDFTAELGWRLEAYLGRQLSLLGLPLSSEIEWSEGRGQRKKSVDWFVETPNYVILIECKSARMSLDAKAGGHSYATVIDRYIGEAARQVSRTDAVIRRGQSEFSSIPSKKARVGMIVTAEPFYAANSLDVRAMLPASALPVMTVSIREVEILATLTVDEIEQVIARVWNDPELSTWHLTQALKEVVPECLGRRNPIIDDSYMSAFNFIPE